MNFLEAADRAPPDASAVPNPRPVRERCWEDERALLPVMLTSAVELDEQTMRHIGDQVGKQKGRTVELSSHVDPDILGGIVLRVGNFILDASIRNRLEKLRKQVAQG